MTTGDLSKLDKAEKRELISAVNDAILKQKYRIVVRKMMANIRTIKVTKHCSIHINNVCIRFLYAYLVSVHVFEHCVGNQICLGR